VSGEAGGTVEIGAIIVSTVLAVLSNGQWHWIRSSERWDACGSCGLLAELVKEPRAIVIGGRVGV